jgi:lysozyme family protein
MNFDQAFHKLLGHEGGYVDHPSDPGGATNWGITQAVARKNGYTGHMRDFPAENAKVIYWRQYWVPIKADELPPFIRYAVFDGAVNSGNVQSVKWLQRAIGVNDDGYVGPQTITFARAAAPDFVLRRMLSERLKFMTDLKTWQVFGRGWARRVAELLQA